MTKLRIGVISTANIGLKKVIPAMQRGRLTVVTAIASRDLAKAQAAARSLGIARAYGSYDELLADPAIDAIYNPLPNHGHVPWSIRALEAGKHVLCEKPIALSSAEAETLLAAAKQHSRLKIMEAFMYRLHPQWQAARAAVADGSLGDVRTVHSFFSYYNADPANVRNQSGIGGGGLMDIGCYNVSLSRFLFAGEPERVMGIVEFDPGFKTDRLASGILDFGRGTATFTCSTQLTPYQRVHVYGTRGRLEIEIPFNAPNDRPCRAWVESGGSTRETAFPVVDQYTLQGDAFAQAVIEDRPVPTPLEDAVANMRVIERVFESARRGTWA